MSNKYFASSIVLISALFVQPVFAETGQTVTTHESQQTSQGLSRDDVLNGAQGYELSNIETSQPRRSVLFAHILDIAAKNLSLAKLDNSANT